MNLEEIVIKHSSDISGLKVKVDNIENKLEDVSEMKEVLIKLATLQEVQVQTNTEVSSTLKSMDKSLNILNDKVNGLESEIQNSQVKDTNKVEIKKSKLALYGIIIAGVFTLLGIVIPLLIK